MLIAVTKAVKTVTVVFVGFFLTCIIGLKTGYSEPTENKLEEIVRKAVLYHPLIKAAKANERANQQSREIIIGGYLPSIDFTADTGGQSTRSGSTDNELTGTWRKSATLTVNQSLYDGGERDQQLIAEERRITAAQFTIREERETIALAAVEAFFDLRRARLEFTFSEENLEIHKTVAEQIKIRAEREGALGDVYQSESRLALAQSRFNRAEAAMRAAETEFELIVGTPAPPTLEEPGEPVPLSMDFDSLMAELQNNPQWRASQEEVAARQAEAESTKSEFLPQIDFELTENRERDTDGLNNRNIDRRAVITFDFNLYQGGSSSAREKEALERVSEAYEQARATRLEVERQVRLDYSDYLAAQAGLEPARIRALASGEALIAYRRQFEIQRRTLLDILDAERELFQSKTDLVNAESNAHVTRYRVLSAVGLLSKHFEL